MLIGIISDSHDHLDRLNEAVDRLIREGADSLIHPGDVIAPFAAKVLLRWPRRLDVVYGNNDGERRGLKTVLPQIVDGPVLLELGGRRINVDHYPPDAAHPPHSGADILVYGHTHEVYVERRDGILHVNPGECCGWVTGRATIATLDTESMRVEIIPLVK